MSMAEAPSATPLPPWLEDPRRIVFQIEAFVVGAAILLFFQLIFGFSRRLSSNKFIQGGVWVAYTLSFPLATYTLGMMRSSPVKSPLYPVWAVSLFLVSGCANSITAYDLDDNKQWKKILFELLQYDIYASMIFQLLYHSHFYDFKQTDWPHVQPIIFPATFLFAMFIITNFLRVIACWMVNFSDPSKVVTDYMRDQADSREEGYDPIGMKGYNYLVGRFGHYLFTHDAEVPIYRNKLDGDDIITIDMIWEKCNNSPSDSNGPSQLKDVCLSFALFHLLKRRYFGMICHEADLPETREFVLKGLLSENGDDYARAFRIIEVELGFLHDFFFTKNASVYENEILFFGTSILKIVFTVILGVFLCRNSIQVETLSPIIKVDMRNSDIMITLMILGGLLVVDILQALLYLASDWALVSLACNYVRNGSDEAIRNSLLSKTIWTLRRGILLNYWQNKIGQYSVMEGCLRHAVQQQELPKYLRNMLLISIAMRLKIQLYTVMREISTFQCCRRSTVQSVRLPDIVKREIASSLNSSGSGRGHLKNGEASLQRNNVLSLFSWTLDTQDWNQTDTMLIWHIATSYCEIALPQVDDKTSPGTVPTDKEYREVAVKLSKYSAYLMAFLPELLPGNSADTKFTFNKVMKEARAVLQGDTVDKGRLLEVLNAPRRENESKTIFLKGLKLGLELEEHIEDSLLRWKVMAQFWAETILYVAPSNNVRGHVQQIANGGEFLTHVWALLSHAGILTRPKSQESQDIV